jgi:hypothetical protein
MNSRLALPIALCLLSSCALSAQVATVRFSNVSGQPIRSASLTLTDEAGRADSPVATVAGLATRGDADRTYSFDRGPHNVHIDAVLDDGTRYRSYFADSVLRESNVIELFGDHARLNGTEPLPTKEPTKTYLYDKNGNLRSTEVPPPRVSSTSSF